MRRYSKYKDSGDEWIEQVPSTWEIKRLHHLSEIENSGIWGEDFPTENSVPVSVPTTAQLSMEGRWSFEEMAIRNISEEEFKKYICKEGDVVIVKSSGSSTNIITGKCGYISKEDAGRFSFGNFLMRVRPTRINPKLVYYFLTSNITRQRIERMVSATTYPNLKVEEYVKSTLFVPPLAEQQSIVAFLDDKTSQIDSLISNSQQKIELLKEKRTALINHAVTKGLNPKAKMKDSGVEWIGEIPVGWDIKPLKYLGSFQNGISKPGDMFGTGFPFLNYGDVYNYEAIPLNPSGLVESSHEEREQYSVRNGDVFFTRTSESKDDIGVCSVCLETIDECVFSGFVIRFRFNKNQQLPEYSKYHFQAHWKKLFIESQMNIVTRASLSQQVLGLVPVLLPSLSEQQEIVEYLNHQTSEIDKEVTLEQKRIELLKEYRQSLISEVVTGKINVSDYAVQPN
jgi:type I restriction enzyme S subunit